MLTENPVHLITVQEGSCCRRMVPVRRNFFFARRSFSEGGYGPLGEVVKNIRTVVIPQHDEQTYTTEWAYDTWNRLTTMTYADGEKVTYIYNAGGLLRSMDGKKKSATFSYVKQLGYDKFEQRVFLAYGNGTKTTYSYESDRRRLKKMTAE